MWNHSKQFTQLKFRFSAQFRYCVRSRCPVKRSLTPKERERGWETERDIRMANVSPFDHSCHTSLFSGIANSLEFHFNWTASDHIYYLSMHLIIFSVDDGGEQAKEKRNDQFFLFCVMQNAFNAMYSKASQRPYAVPIDEHQRCVCLYVSICRRHFGISIPRSFRLFIHDLFAMPFRCRWYRQHNEFKFTSKCIKISNKRYSHRHMLIVYLMMVPIGSCLFLACSLSLFLSIVLSVSIEREKKRNPISIFHKNFTFLLS